MKSLDLPEMTCVRLEAPFESRVDPGWLLGRSEAARLVPVTLADRSPRAAPGLKTLVACAWSPTHLHVAFNSEDSDAWSTYSRRDDPLYEEEVVEVFLSPTGDVRRYFELELSPRSVVFDAAVHSPNRQRGTMTVDTSWNCEGLETEVITPHPVHTSAPNEQRRGEPGWWQGAFHIPFAGLGVKAPRPGEVWRVNFYRIDRPAAPAPPEFHAWSPTAQTPANFHVPDRFGRLVFGDR